MPNQLLFSHEIPESVDITVHRLSLQLTRELKWLFSKPIQSDSQVICVCYYMKNDMCNVGKDVEKEKKELLHRVYINIIW